MRYLYISLPASSLPPIFSSLLLPPWILLIPPNPCFVLSVLMSLASVISPSSWRRVTPHRIIPPQKRPIHNPLLSLSLSLSACQAYSSMLCSSVLPLLRFLLLAFFQTRWRTSSPPRPSVLPNDRPIPSGLPFKMTPPPKACPVRAFTSPHPLAAFFECQNAHLCPPLAKEADTWSDIGLKLSPKLPNRNL